MHNFYLQLLMSVVTAAVLSVVVIPGLIRIAFRLKMVDLPNDRKVHQTATPRLGGVAIFAAAFCGLFLCRQGWEGIRLWPVFIASVVFIFLVGVWDDTRSISAKKRFLLQICAALAVAACGIRLTSLYGLGGIQNLTVGWQYLITVLLVVGTTNAFNLIDGVDGLAGGLSLIGLIVQAVLSWRLDLLPLAILLMAFAGAVAGFLKYNLSPARIFMGDGGSLMMGFLLSVSGILLIGKAQETLSPVSPQRVLMIVTAVLVVPVFDTLRVFAGRIRRGISPFRADKTHIHHLLLVAGFNHRKTAFLLYGLEFLLVMMALLLAGLTAITYIIGMMLLIFHLATLLLRVNQEMEQWLSVIKQMEKE